MRHPFPYLELSPEGQLYQAGMEAKENSTSYMGMIGTSPAMLQVFNLIRKVATTDFPVLITGASGTGKEMVAKAIHLRSKRAQGPFVALNCGAIPRELMESELFGHERGAFTGAFRTVAGKAELANRGVLFLDEIGELPLEVQVKLLRFLQEFSFERVGGRQSIEVDVRVISATNCDLNEMMRSGSFRDDLYYRLDGINIELPPLRDRDDDVLIMAKLFIQHVSSELGKDLKGFTQAAIRTLQRYSWPGNVRELINRIRRAGVMAEAQWVTPKDLGLDDPEMQVNIQDDLSLAEIMAQFEAKLVSNVLAKCGGNVAMAARSLKTSRSVIYHLIKKYSLKEFVSALVLGVSLGVSLLYGHSLDLHFG
jgi:two-component system, NtrC family, response regulator